jgi:CheY-like chemotaxis protein
MTPRAILLVEADVVSGRTLARVLRRQGARVKVAQTRSQALLAVRRASYDIAVVDMFVAGGGPELALELEQWAPSVVLSLGVGLDGKQALEAANGFPVLRKEALAVLLRAGAASSSGRASAGRPRGSRRPRLAASEPAPEPPGRVLDPDPSLA